jgi:hypothetical protein
LSVRREKSGDWVGTAVGELDGDGDYIGKYGLTGYFVKSREMLKKLEDAKNADNEAS